MILALSFNNLLQWLQAIDGRGFFFVNHRLQNGFFDVIMPWFTHMGSGGLIWLLLAFVLAVFGKGAGRKMAFLGMLALLLGWFLSDEVLKNLFARPRPFLTFPDVRILADKPLQFSFPSGHTTVSFAPAVVFFLKNRQVGVLSLILAVFIGFSRIYVGVHYPLDVLGGAILGGVVGWFVVYSEGYIDKLIIRGKDLLQKRIHKNRMKERV